MKRDESLAPLSRDHHGSLILAQLLKKNAPVYKGLPTEPAEKAKYAQEQFTAHIKSHFIKEEAILELIKDCDEAVIDLAADVFNEHQQLEDLFSALSTTDDLVATMHILALTLQDHIRKEERVLFPLLQQHCSAEQLQEIHELLH